MLIDELKSITSEIQKEFGNLNTIQLNWKPMNDSWSIAQVLDHIIVSNRCYFESLKKAALDKYKPSLWERVNPFTKYTGQNLITNLGEKMQKKYVSPMLYRPRKGMIDQDIIDNFRKMQDELCSLVSPLQNHEYRKRVITSPVANLITIKVNDAIELILGHEKRHLKQALAILNNSDFPHEKNKPG